MDVPPIADATPEPAFPPPTPAPSPLPGLEARLANLEVTVAEMNERLHALGVSLEASLREAVTQEVQVVSGELRRTVAELGRLLVRDLGKLSKLLSEHRDAIVAELAGEERGAHAVPAAAPSTPSPAAEGDDTPSSTSPGGLFDGTPLLGPKTGVGWYTHELIDAVARQAPDDDLLVFPISWRTARMLRLDPPHRPNVSVTRKIAPARPLWAMWERIAFPPMEWLVNCDVFHATNFMAPPSLRVPTVVTVHDIGFIRRPESVSPAIRRMARLLPTVLRRASVVITVSKFTRDELVWWLPDVADRISVIPNGIHHRKVEPGDTGLPPGPPYALMLGTLEPRKNVALALDAMRILRQQNFELRLVLAGSPSPLLDVPALLRKRGLGPPEVVRTGYVDDARVAALVAGASMLVFPSLYEGFGMPVIEAMDAGLPVVAARAGATPEVAGDAAVLVDPEDPEAFADAMRRVATDDELRAGVIEAGRRRAQRFSWDNTARATLRLYRGLAG